MPSSHDPASDRYADTVGGRSPASRGSELPFAMTSDPLALKKRKRELEEQGKENATVYSRYSNPHIYQKVQQHGKELAASNRAMGIRARLQPALLKRRRVEQSPDEHRPLSIPWPIAHSPATPHLLSPPTESPDPESLSTNLHYFQKQPVNHTNKPATEPSNSKSSLLNPCHICHRRPTTRSVLDAYGDCNLCSKRACYICLRECLGPHCRGLPPISPRSTHRSTTTNSNDTTKREHTDGDTELEGKKICSSCAVEGVTEYGEDIVWCLDCVERDRCAMETS